MTRKFFGTDGIRGRANNPTSAFSGRRTLCDVRSNALFDSLHLSSFSVFGDGK